VIYFYLIFPINKSVALLRFQNIVMGDSSVYTQSSSEMCRGLETRGVSPLKYPVTFEYIFFKYYLKQKYVS